MNLNQITISSLDVASSISFYKKIGLKLIVKSLPHYARFESPDGDATFSIQLVETLPKEKGTTIYFETTSLDKEVARLRESGIHFNLLPTDQPWLWREAHLQDSDGNSLILYYAGDNRKSPPWRVDENESKTVTTEKATESLEIERKFLVNSEVYKQEAVKKTRITQGYLSTDPERTVRVRVKGKQGFLTIKGKSNESGTTRIEVEEEISVSKAETLLKLCLPGVIDKTRYEVKAGKHLWEIDEFYGANEGLTLAEIELKTENEAFSKPNWVEKEVTGDKKYYNSQLSNRPFKGW